MREFTTPTFDEDGMLVTSTCQTCKKPIAVSVDEIEAHEYPGKITPSVMLLVLSLKCSLHIDAVDPRGTPTYPF